MENKRVIKILSVVFVYFLAVFLTVLVARTPSPQGNNLVSLENTVGETTDYLEETESDETVEVSDTASEEASEMTSDLTENTADSMETKDDEGQTSEETASSASPSESEETETQSEGQKPTQGLSQSEEFVRLMGKAGCDINAVDCNQLVIVESSGNSAVVYLYEKDSSGIWTDSGLTVSGWVGSNGVDEKSQEGDYKTPSGLYSIGEAFYIYDQPKTGLSSFQVTDQTYWVDDPNSAYYNQKVEGTANMDWNSAEHMISYSVSYKYGFVVNFNMDPIIPGKGSAIFFHCGSGPTAGCVAVPESSVLSYLERLDKNKNPYILMM